MPATSSSWLRTTYYVAVFVLLFFVSPQTWNLKSGTLNLGPTPAYGQSADLAATPDADKDDPYIVQKAADLNHDPAQIFAFMQNEIGYESYKGSLRGARGTLWSKAGNALDQASLMIALLRASGIPARYVKGTLSDANAKTVILSMFPNPLRVFGCLDPGVEVADPADDTQLLSETKEHYWVQFGAGNTNVDPTFPGATMGQTFATAQGAFTEVPDALRHKVTIHLNRELTLPGASLLTGGAAGGDLATVLDQTFNTVELVGRSLSLGHFVNSGSLGAIFTSVTHRYSPYLLVNQRDGNIFDDPLFPGSDYQEVLSSFPFGSQILTGLFLEAVLRFPDGRLETIEKTLFDRIGFAARNGGGGSLVSISGDAPPAITSQDVVTLDVTPSTLPDPVFLSQRNDLEEVFTEINALPADFEIPAVTNPDAEQALRVFEQLALESTSLFAGNFVLQSDWFSDSVGGTLLTSGYLDSPRIVAVQQKWQKGAGGQANLTLAIDILRNASRSHPRPGQAQFAAQVDRFYRGLLDSTIEHLVLSSEGLPGASDTAGSMDIVLRGLSQPGARLLLFTSENLSELSVLHFPEEANARISQTVLKGKAVLVPSQTVLISGKERLAWLEVNTVSGDLLSVLDDGSHGLGDSLGARASSIRSGTQVLSFKKPPDIQTLIKLGRELGQSRDVDKILQVKKAIRAELDSLGFAGKLTQATFVQAEGTIATLFARAKEVDAVKAILPKDPPVGPLLFSISEVSPEFAPLNGGGGVPLAAVPDPIFTVPVGGSLIPTVFKVGFKSNSASTDTFEIDVSNVPAGFSVDQSVPSLTLSPGEIGEVSVCLRPTGGVPASGTPASFAVKVTSTSNSAITATDTESFTVPDIREVTVATDPSIVNATPGSTTGVALALTAIGNGPATMTLTASTPNGVSLNGLPSSVSLTAGETKSFPFSLNVGGGVALNQSFNIVIRGKITGAPEPNERTTSIQLNVRSTETAQVADAAQVAAGKSNTSLASALSALSDAFAQLQVNPSNAALCEQVQFRLTNLNLVLQADPNLTIFNAQLQDVRTQANNCHVAGLVSLLPTLAQTLAQAAAGTTTQGVVVAIAPNSPVTEPGATVGADILLKNRGNSSVQVSLTLEGLPNLVQSVVPGGSFTLGAGATQTVPISLTPSVEGHFPFRAVAHVTGVTTNPEASGVLTAIEAAVNVMSVVGSPPFILQNGTTRIKATVANTVNIPLSAKATVTIKRSDGQTQYESPSPILINIPVSDSTATFDLDQVSATNWPEGFYTVEVRLLNQSNNLIPGGQGTGSLPVATPIKASVSADPILVPPGNSNVTTAIRVEPRFAVSGGGSVGLEATDPSKDRINWAAASRGASISTSGPLNANIPVSRLIDEGHSGTEHYIGVNWPTGGFFLLDLGTVRPIDFLQLHIWDGDARVTRYRVESSTDGVSFSTLVDKTTGEHTGIQRLTFPATSIRYIKIIGSFDSVDGSYFYLTDEILAIGDSPASPVPTQTVTIDGDLHSANNNPAVGPAIELNAGIYEIKHVGGAVSFYPNDSDNNGKTWGGKVNVSIPLVPKEYQLGYIHDTLSLFATQNEAAAAALGKSFKLYLPFHTKVSFWIHDPEPSGNRGTETIEIRQLSGPNDSLPVRVRDAMIRSVLWEQPEVAGWKGFGSNKWIETANYDCFGCHVQTQGSYGLEASRQKLPELPVDQKLMDRFVDAYLGWQNTDGSISSFNTAWITQTSLAAWAMARFTGAQFERLGGTLLKALDFLLTKQQPNGAWNADHTDGNALRLYFDGTPSATHTAGNIEALAKALDYVQGKAFVPVPSTQATVAGNEVTFPQNPGNEFEVGFTSVSNVTGVRITITDTFSNVNNGNFVISEFEAFNGADNKTVVSATANFEQNGYPIIESFNNIRNDTTDGWAYFPQDSRTTPARAVWVFSGPVTLDHLRITQIYPTHQLKKFTLEFTTDASPTLASSFSPATSVQIGLSTPLRAAAYRTALLNAASALSSPSFSYSRNTRAAAQTIIGLKAALPVLTGSAATAAQARIAEANTFLRNTQRDDGGWKDDPNDATDVSRALQTAQALEALLLVTQSSVDPAILAGAEFLLATQLSEGSWQQPSGLQRRLASTTWVEIALPTIFENLAALTVEVDHRVPTGTGMNPVAGSFAPPLDSQQNGGGQTTLHWDALIGSAGQNFTFDAQLQGMQPGEVRQISNGTTVNFTSVAGQGTVELPELFVSAKHILSLDPPTRSVQAGSTATFTVTLENLLGATENFTLMVDGVPSTSVTFPETVTLSAGEKKTLTLLIEAPVNSVGGEYGFTVGAQSVSGVTDFVSGSVGVTEAPGGGGGDPPQVTLGTLAVDVALTPIQKVAGRGTATVYVVRVTNVGDETDTYTLEKTLPGGFTGQFAETTVTVPPGLGNFRDVEFVVTPPAGADAGDRNFSVRAVSTKKAAVQDEASGLVTVVGQGVGVDISPSSNGPGGSFQMTVTNLGTGQDTFDLTLSGPVGVVSTLGVNVVTLGPGASQNVAIGVGAINFAFPGNLELIGTATSRGNGTVKDSDRALVNIGHATGLSVAFTPSVVELPIPGEATFLLLVNNSGNGEDAYSAEIVSTSGPVTAALSGVNHQGIQKIDLFRLPGLSQGGIVLNTTLNALGEGKVTVKVTSLTDASLTAMAVATVRTPGGPPVMSLDPFLCYRTKSTKGDLCAADALKNVGGSCETEEDCGGQSATDDNDEETDFCVPNKFPRGEQLSLDDAFTTGVFDLRKPVTLCNPAEINVEPTDDPATHVRGFQIKLSKGQCAAESPQNVGAGCRKEEDCGGTIRQTNFCVAQPKFQKQTNLTVTNLLQPDGVLKVDLIKPDRFVTPATKSHIEPLPPPDSATHAVDQYTCYRLKPSKGAAKFPKDLRAKVVDQFAQEKLYDLKRATRLCAPVEANGATVKDATTSLLCYQARQTAKICAASAPSNAGGVCKQEDDCGGIRRQTSFCQAQPKFQKVTELFVSTALLPEQVDTLKEEELCVPSEVSPTP